MTHLLHLSDALFLRINDLARASTGLHAPAVAYARYGLVAFAALILLGVWRRRGASDRDLAAAVWAGAGTLLAVAVNQPVAALVAEARPYAVHPAALTLVDRTTDWSFPSDHSVMAGAVAVGLLLVSRRLGALALAAAVLMAATRVYVGAHYPHDVVAGLLLGAAVADLGWLLVRLPLTRLVGALRTLPVIERVLSPVT
ncbi:UDP-diphosphatase [Terrabacter sp. Soil811]|uniref:phosphatase PAP2 family protein n=1 Tax=Terrabacter sp. Soil811 TaxID=1736419 RepID=UPI000701475F|nr:phosphatase PAP2 family protein [Terrabacter sp. Soil811]KRF48776.1 UDP-diphosphatase [Terrabacter sp. Soil811]